MLEELQCIRSYSLHPEVRVQVSIDTVSYKKTGQETPE